MLKVINAFRHDSSPARTRCESHRTPKSAAARTASWPIDGPVSGEPPPPAPVDPIGVEDVASPSGAWLAGDGAPDAPGRSVAASGTLSRAAGRGASPLARRVAVALSALGSAHSVGAVAAVEGVMLAACGSSAVGADVAVVASSAGRTSA